MNFSLLYATASVVLAAAIGSWTAPAPAVANTDPIRIETASAGLLTARVDVATRYAPLVQRL
ncbi:MAG TPA: hypothetical protein VLF18_11115, partial [Tahibacter sp.]|uniref:hypothetical protein n=1 Tax=Tahibacter sp. TaxID=2056211 RepID=UPI002BDFB482